MHAHEATRPGVPCPPANAGAGGPPRPPASAHRVSRWTQMDKHGLAHMGACMDSQADTHMGEHTHEHALAHEPAETATATTNKRL